MKKILYSIFTLLVISSCSKNDTELHGTQDCDAALKLTISASDYATRATDNGMLTTFENGDKVGLIILENGAIVESNNLPYTLNGKLWEFDKQTCEQEQSGKIAYYWGSSDVELIVYYPYSPDANSAASIDDLKTLFTPSEDQESSVSYRNSDLMIWSKSYSESVDEIQVVLEHAYSSFAFSLKQEYELCDKANTKLLIAADNIKDLVFSLNNGKTIKPYKAPDMTYRCILDDNYSGNVVWSYNYNSEPYIGSRTVSATSNTCFSQVEKFKYKYDFSIARSGDYLCVEDNLCYPVPSVADANFVATANCKGIIFYLGNGADSDNFGLLSGTKGMAVSLSEMAFESSTKMSWSYGGTESISEWLKGSTWMQIGRPEQFTAITAQDKWQGYANTLAMREFNASVEANNNKRIKLITALDSFISANPLPASTSGWFLPSIYDVKTLCRGQGNESVLENMVEGRNTVNQSINKLTGAQEITNDDYWTSTEVNATNAINFYVKSSWYGANGSNKSSSSYKVRAVFAF